MAHNSMKLLPGDSLLAETPQGEILTVNVFSGLLETPGCVVPLRRPLKLTHSSALLFSSSNNTRVNITSAQKQKDPWTWTAPYPCAELKALFQHIMSVAHTGLVPWIGIVGPQSSGRKTILYTLAGWLTRAGVTTIVADYDPAGTAVGYPGTISAAHFLVGEEPGSMLCTWGVCSFCDSRKAPNYLTTTIQDRIFSLLTNHDVRGLDKPVVVLYRMRAYQNTIEGRRQLHAHFSNMWSFLEDRVYTYKAPTFTQPQGPTGATMAHFNRFMSELKDEIGTLTYLQAIKHFGKYIPIIISTRNPVQLGTFTILRSTEDKAKDPLPQSAPVPVVHVMIDPLLKDITPTARVQQQRIKEHFYGYNWQLAPMVLRFKYATRVEKAMPDIDKGEQHEFCSIIQLMRDEDTDYARILTHQDFTGATPMNLHERVCYVPRFHDETQGAEILGQHEAGKLSEFLESEEGAIVLLNANIIGLAVIKGYEARDDELYLEILLPTKTIVSEIMLLILTEHYAGGSL